jgi:hypothetical protein
MTLEQINNVLPTDWYLQEDLHGRGYNLWYSDEFMESDVGLDLKYIFKEILKFEKSWAGQNQWESTRKAIKDTLGLWD